MGKPLVALDAGHGGHDSGAVGPTGLKEKDVALDIVKRMRDILAPVADVLLIRSNDTFVELSDRAEIANRHGADLFVSVHCNSAENIGATGFEVFTTPGTTRSDRAASEAFIAYASMFPTLKKRMDMTDGDEDKEANFTVIAKTNCPAYLFELEFISNPSAEGFLRSDSNRRMMAEALCMGIRKFLSLSGETKPATPEPPATSKLQEILTHARAIIELASK